MVRVLVAGSAALDFVYQVEALPQEPKKYAAQHVEIVGGGCAANATVAIARLGGDAQLLARFGRDPVCDLVLDDIRAEGVDVSPCVVSDGGRSAMSSVYVDALGERQIMAFRGSDLVESPGDLALEANAVLADTRWPEAARQVIEMGNALGIPTVLDGEAPVPTAIAASASHVVFSEQGLMEFAGLTDLNEAFKKASKDLPGWVAVTLGADGVLGPGGHMPSFKVDVKDTLGAGDVWHGAFTMMLAEERSEEEAMRFANAAAALKCERLGGRKAAPSRTQVEKFLKERT